MKPGLFISYSRRQTPFVDSLVEKLTKNEYSIWLDYHNLVPARPWFDQIMEGLNGAGAVLLIVSKDSIESTNVADEWKTALKLNKRIVLVIFETCPLPEELQNCEWVDFRGDFKENVEELRNLLDRPKTSMSVAPPQSGFKAPLIYWVALILSIFVAIGSIPMLWTVYIPFILMPLPWQIYKRNYNFSQVVSTLIFFPLLVRVSFFLFLDPSEFLYKILAVYLGNPLFFIGLVLSPVLLGILLTSSMQRRATPEATRVRYANPLIVDKRQKPRSVLFIIDHAPEDGRYADDLRKGLEKHGHRMAQINETPEAIFVLISAYKKSTNFDPDSQVVYPVILQSVSGISDNLGRIQWIDFRRGIRNIDKLAKLLPEPERLLKAIATPPMNSREIYPFVVDVLQYFFLWTGMLYVGFILITLLAVDVIQEDRNLMGNVILIIPLVVTSTLLFGMVLYVLRGVRSRTSGTSAIYPLFILVVFQWIFLFLTEDILSNMEDIEKVKQRVLLNVAMDSGMDNFFQIIVYCAILLLVVVLLTIFRWRELYRWLPRYQVVPADRIESFFLLYSPLRLRALVCHLVFHVGLLVWYLLVYSAISDSYYGHHVNYDYLFFLTLTLFGVHWLARRLDKK